MDNSGVKNPDPWKRWILIEKFKIYRYGKILRYGKIFHSKASLFKSYDDGEVKNVKKCLPSGLASQRHKRIASRNKQGKTLSSSQTDQQRDRMMLAIALQKIGSKIARRIMLGFRK